MRVVLIIVMVICYGVLDAQYVKGLAPDSVDAYVVVVESQYRVVDKAGPRLASEKLLAYWSKQKESSDAGSVNQNFYYSYTQDLLLKNSLDLISKDSLDQILELEDAIKLDLPYNKMALAEYYYMISELHRKVTKDVSKRTDYLKKSLNLYGEDENGIKRGKVSVLNSLGSVHRTGRKFDVAKTYLEQAVSLNLQLEVPDTASLINSYYDLGATLYYLRNYEDGTKAALEGYNLSETYLDTGHEKLPLFVRLVDFMYSASGSFQEGLAFAERSLISQIDENGVRAKGVASYYASISGIQQRLGDIRASNNYIDSAIMYAERDSERTLIPGYIHNKALITKDSDEAIVLYKKAYELCAVSDGCSDGSQSIMLQNLGNEYFVSGNVQTALNYVTQSKIIKESDYDRLGVYLPSTYGSLALINSTLGHVNLAIEYQSKSLKTVREFRPKGSFFVGTELARLGRFYIDADRLEEAEEVLEEAIEILERTVGNKNEQTILTYRYLSRLYKEKSELDYAVIYGKKSLKAARLYGMNENAQLKLLADLYTAQENLDSAKVYMNLILKESGVVVGDSIRSKVVENPWLGFVGYLNYLKVEERIFGLKQSGVVGKIGKAIEIIDEIRSDYFFKSSEQEFQKATREFFNWSLRKLSNEYDTEPTEATLELILQCIEKSKSITINRNFVRRNSLWEGGLPASVLDREKRILEDYSLNYDKYNRTTEGDSLKNVYADNMYQLELEREDYIKYLMEEYPDYYQNRYDQSTVSLKETADFAEAKNIGIQLLHWGDSSVYSMIVTPEQVEFRTIKMSELDVDLSVMERVLNNQVSESSESDFNVTKADFIQSSKAIYDQLYQGQGKMNMPFDLVIVPDGRFVKLPFEALVTKDDSPDDSYRDLSYLLKDHAISYAGDVKHVVRSGDKSSAKNELLYGGFAPKYNIDSTLLLIDSLSAKRAELYPLLYNLEEVERSADLFDGDVFLGVDASEGKFNKNGSDYRILHLAMHTSLNDQYPMESYLSFSNSGSIDYDNQLHVNEIAKMNLNADLVVLSACETNNGEEFLGEGVLGIAKAFQLASCSNIVLSNWLVDDRSSSKIIFSFFTNLFNSEPPSHALRMAKLDFLSSSAVTYSHPKYWAAFSYYGSAEKFDFNHGVNTDVYSKWIFLFLLFSFLVAWRLFKKS